MLYPSLSTMCFWSSSHQEMESAPPVLGPGPASWPVLASGTYLKYMCDSSEPRPTELPCVLQLPLGSLSLPLEQVWPSLVHNERPSDSAESSQPRPALPSSPQLTCQLTSELWASPAKISQATLISAEWLHWSVDSWKHNKWFCF